MLPGFLLAKKKRNGDVKESDRIVAFVNIKIFRVSFA